METKNNISDKKSNTVELNSQAYILNYLIQLSILSESGAFVAVIALQLDSQIPVQSVPITTDDVSSTPEHGEVYLIQHYVIKFVSDLRQVSDFLRFPQQIRIVRHDITEILLKVALNTKPIFFYFSVFRVFFEQIWTMQKNMGKSMGR